MVGAMVSSQILKMHLKSKKISKNHKKFLFYMTFMILG